MQYDAFPNTDDFSGERALLGLSGGINSAALLCYLASEHPAAKRPSTLLMYYAHLKEHSPDTAPFVFDCVRYARKHFEDTTFRLHRTSMNDWVRENKMVPHPTVSPCTSDLKVQHIEAFGKEQGATVDLIGYVRSERKRIQRQKGRSGMEQKRYPIAHMSDADCFSIVEREIGWYPEIYDLRYPDEEHIKPHRRGKRMFTHNNCLPCKNMSQKQMQAVQMAYPDYWQRAVAAADAVDSYWGRDSDYAGDPCAVCAFD